MRILPHPVLSEALLPCPMPLGRAVIPASDIERVPAYNAAQRAPIGALLHATIRGWASHARHRMGYDSLARNISAFANADGGLLPIGVAANGDVMGITPDEGKVAHRRINAIAPSSAIIASIHDNPGLPGQRKAPARWLLLFPPSRGKVVMATDIND